MKHIILLIVLILNTACAIEKKGGNINTHKVAGLENVAIKGYDPVAYFKDHKPTKGNEAHQISWHGATWLFTSDENKHLFKVNPKKYAPQYGGYCAYGVSVPQKKIDINPKAWYIHKDKLYLNYTKPTQDIWLENKEEHIEAANENWKFVKKQ